MYKETLEMLPSDKDGNQLIFAWMGAVFSSGLFEEAVTVNDRKMLEMLRAVFTKMFDP